MTNNKPFDPTKPVQTRHGRKARIICTNRNQVDGNIIALITYPDDSPHAGQESCLYYYADGKYAPPNLPDKNPWDLVNIPVRKSKWQNVYKDGTTGCIRDTKCILGSFEKLASCIGVNEYILEEGVCVDVVFHRNNDKE